jgi:PPP family 3-phenylpropionic acid transporter
MLIFAARLAKWWGPGKALTLSCLVAAGRWLFLSQSTDLDLMLALQPLHAISFGLMWVSAMGALRREVGFKGTATAQGLFGSAIAVGSILGMSTWGPIYDAFGSERVFFLAACVSAVAALSASRLIRLTRSTPLVD